MNERERIEKGIKKAFQEKVKKTKRATPEEQQEQLKKQQEKLKEKKE